MLRGIPQRSKLGALKDLVVLPRVKVLSSWRLRHRECSFRRVLGDRIAATELQEDWRVPFAAIQNHSCIIRIAKLECA